MSIRKIICFALFLAVGFSLGYVYSNDLFPAPAKVKQDLESEHVYSVEEARDIMLLSPRQFMGKDIFLRAAVVDATDGLGCGDYLLLTDPEFAALYKSRYDRDLTAEEKKILENIPIIKSGPSLAMPKDIDYNPDDCVFRGHFFDPGLKACEQSWERFVITGIK